MICRPVINEVYSYRPIRVQMHFSWTTLLEKLVNIRKNQARYFRKIYGTGSVFVFP